MGAGLGSELCDFTDTSLQALKSKRRLGDGSTYDSSPENLDLEDQIQTLSGLMGEFHSLNQQQVWSWFW